jgi:hypothetical protein
VRLLSTNGAPAFQSRPLGPCVIKNSQNSITHGESVTNTIANWVSKKFVAGPFRCPPLENFRANAILAIPQTNKTRVCINVSQPSGKSFNDNINSFDLEKVKMSSARNFGYSIIEAGPKCVMAKPDIVDAYKNVPAKYLSYATRVSRGWEDTSWNLDKCLVRRGRSRTSTF